MFEANEAIQHYIKARQRYFDEKNSDKDEPPVTKEASGIYDILGQWYLQKLLDAGADEVYLRKLLSKRCLPEENIYTSKGWSDLARIKYNRVCKS